MAHHHWPLFDLRVTTPRLELRYVDDELAVALADLAVEGIHDPDAMPFGIPWTRQENLPQEYLKHHWRCRAALRAEAWTIALAVLEDGVPVGVQDLLAKDFAVTRAFETGSWLGRRFQGRGIGTEMRAAAVHLGFAGLGADLAQTGAWHDNGPSQGVTRKLGYEPDGWTLLDREGTATRMLRFHLPRERWEPNRRADIQLHGVDAVVDLLDAGAP